MIFRQLLSLRFVALAGGGGKFRLSRGRFFGKELPKRAPPESPARSCLPGS